MAGSTSAAAAVGPETARRGFPCPLTASPDGGEERPASLEDHHYRPTGDVRRRSRQAAVYGSNNHLRVADDPREGS